MKIQKLICFLALVLISKNVYSQSSQFKMVRIYGLPLITTTMLPYSYTPEKLKRNNDYYIEFRYKSPVSRFSDMVKEMDLDTIEAMQMDSSFTVEELRVVIEFVDFKDETLTQIWIEEMYSKIWYVDARRKCIYPVNNSKVVAMILEKDLSLFFHFYREKK